MANGIPTAEEYATIEAFWFDVYVRVRGLDISAEAAEAALEYETGEKCEWMTKMYDAGHRVYVPVSQEAQS